MLGICLVAFAAGFAIAYNIRHHEPIEGSGGTPDRIEEIAEWSLLGVSIVNIAYYAMVLMALIQLLFDANSADGRTLMSIAILVVLVAVGMGGGMDWLNKLEDPTTAFNLAAVVGVVVLFVVANVQEMLGGRWELGPSPDLGSEQVRKMLGLFAVVQNFEASRYIGVRFGAQQRVTTMRVAQNHLDRRVRALRPDVAAGLLAASRWGQAGRHRHFRGIRVPR